MRGDIYTRNRFREYSITFRGRCCQFPRAHFFSFVSIQSWRRAMHFCIFVDKKNGGRKYGSKEKDKWNEASCQENGIVLPRCSSRVCVLSRECDLFACQEDTDFSLRSWRPFRLDARVARVRAKLRTGSFFFLWRCCKSSSRDSAVTAFFSSRPYSQGVLLIRATQIGRNVVARVVAAARLRGVSQRSTRFASKMHQCYSRKAAPRAPRASLDTLRLSVL